MKKYFEGCKTAEELKKAYRQVVKEVHPDKGGRKEDFQEMQSQFEKAWERLKNIHHDKEGREYTKETNETAAEFMDIIEELLKLGDVEIEICGSWIWCTGNTRPYRETFKKLHFKWSPKKTAWYYHREPYRKYNNRELSLDEIRGMYGSQKFERKEEQRFALQV